MPTKVGPTSTEKEDRSGETLTPFQKMTLQKKTLEDESKLGKMGNLKKMIDHAAEEIKDMIQEKLRSWSKKTQIWKRSLKKNS